MSERERYGMLTVEAVSGKGDSAKATCVCACGKTVLRAYKQLAQTVKQGGKPCCKDCQKRLRRGLRLEGRRL